MRLVLIIKPGFISYTDKIMQMLASQIMILARKDFQMTLDLARQFYKVHEKRVFFDDLVTYMSSSPVVVFLVEGDVQMLRDMVGTTDPAEAEDGTVRAIYGLDVQKNAIHCSDSRKSAEYEIATLDL